MEYEQLKRLNKTFAQETIEFNNDFFKLHRKWFKKSPRMTMVMSIHLPINMIMSMIGESEIPVHELFPELPDMFIRFVAPFIKLREKWGKIPGDEFAEEYQKLYESQFNKVFETDEDKEKFQKWFEGSNNGSK